MELKNGYKQTEVGVIPEDWEVFELGKLSDVIMGQSPLGSSYNKVGEGIALINGPTEFTNIHPIKTQWTTQPTKLCKKNDLLICVRGSSTGRMNISDEEYCIGRGIAAIRAKEISNTIYLSNQVSLGIEKLLSLSAGSTFPNVDGKSIRSISIPTPPTLAEQTAIADALGDADALIQSTEKLIAKKRAIKLGAMQELFKPKGEWSIKELGSLFEITAGGDLRKNEFSYFNDTEHPYPIYSNGLSRNGLYGYSSSYDYEESCITVTARGTVGYANNRDHKFCAIGRLLILKPKELLDCTFISEFMNLRINFVNESTGVPQLTAPQISKYEVIIPNVAEQSRIASILSDMDAEIFALEAKLSKYKRIKQGMMQNLLTGRVRLA